MSQTDGWSDNTSLYRVREIVFIFGIDFFRCYFIFHLHLISSYPTSVILRLLIKFRWTRDMCGQDGQDGYGTKLLDITERNIAWQDRERDQAFIILNTEYCRTRRDKTGQKPRKNRTSSMPLTAVRLFVYFIWKSRVRCIFLFSFKCNLDRHFEEEKYVL